MAPSAVRRLVSEWHAAGSPAQEAIEWPRQRWTDRFPAQSSTFAVLPDSLSRVAVRKACLEADASPADAERAFLAVMAWGYGRVGYGPFGVQRVLAGTRDPAACLQSAASELASSGPLKAYALLGDNGMPRLPRLGPAFGTKYLYFCSPPGDHPALILDSLGAAWLRDNTNLRFNETRWSSGVYERYLSAMPQWAGELGVAADELEACIFSAQAKRGAASGGNGLAASLGPVIVLDPSSFHRTCMLLRM